MTIFDLKTKLDKSCFVASVIFRKSVTINNWKVKELLEKKSEELDNLVLKAEKAYNKLGLNF
jgi:hypothetical protein